MKTTYIMARVNHIERRINLSWIKTHRPIIYSRLVKNSLSGINSLTIRVQGMNVTLTMGA